ncbi:MAG: Chromosome partition protein Smc [Promethearchaeota archaeon]|nr:MAG: Chromosome partition protein Smc [Candidatus Lokiarchaeota archaeon]
MNNIVEPSQHKNVHLHKVILENFLSFQKDEVVFDDAKFIIIIGPNWSGKTSIYQAITFALGSNERGDRYTNWSSFIRHGQEHAMVELHLQTNHEIIKIRRTVIKGHSPYFSIKHEGDADFKKVNAKEINDLITSLGYKVDNQFAYVSQGKIDSLKDLKPPVLCEFLEEGIGLKGLRTEILQQKKNTEQLHTELISLQTQKKSLNFNLDLLRPKLERLTQKRKLLKEKQIYEDELLWANRQQLLLEIVNLSENVKNFKTLLQKTEETQKENSDNIRAIESEVIAVEEAMNKLSENLGEKRYRKQELVNEINNWQQEKIFKKKELDDLMSKIKEEQKHLKNYQNQQKTISTNIKVIKDEIKKIEGDLEALIQEQANLTLKVEKNKQFLEEYNQLHNQKEDYEDQISKNEKLIKDYESQINQLFESFNDINHKLEKNKWFLENPTPHLLSDLDKELRVTSSQVYDLEEKLKRLEYNKTKMLQEFRRMQSSLSERRVILPTNINILKEEILKRGLAVKGPIIEYIKYDDKLSYAIESVLGEKLLYSFIVEDWDTMNLLKRLKNKFNAYCNFYIPKRVQIQQLSTFHAEGVVGYLAELIQTNDEDVKKVIYSKIKNCLVVNTYRDGQLLYKKHNFKGKCVTLKGEQIISYKYVYETPYLKNLKGLLSAGTQKEQADKLEEKIRQHNDKIAELKVDAGKLDNIQQDLYYKKQSFNDLLYYFKQKQRITQKKNHLYEQKIELEEINASYANEITHLQAKIRELEQKKDPHFFEWNKRLKEIPTLLQSLNEQKKNWNENLQEKVQVENAVEKSLQKTQNAVDVLVAEHSKKKEDFEKADREAFEIYRELDELEETIETIKEDIHAQIEKKKGMEEKKAALNRKSVELQLKLEDFNLKLSTAQLDLDKKNEDLNRIDTKIGEKAKEEDFKPRSINDIRNDISQVDKKLLKYYDVDDSILVEKDRILSSLKKITQNQHNLELDIKAAKKTEDKLEDTYYDKFRGVLTDLESKINTKFKDSTINVYCELELVGSFEELGVDIKAATSNKPLVSCTALSGGQVSMVAIALILSLQEMEPTPLVMFDEASMFLDDKNAEVTYELIRSTLEKNPIQMIMFLPKSSNALYRLAEKLIGVASVGKKEVSTVFDPPKIVTDQEI